MYKIRFSESDKAALKSALTDVGQNIKISTSRSKNTQYKASKTKDYKELSKELRNGLQYLECIAVYYALEDVICPYQNWGQQEKICAIEREFEKLKLKSKLIIFQESQNFHQNCYKKSILKIKDG